MRSSHCKGACKELGAVPTGTHAFAATENRGSHSGCHYSSSLLWDLISSADFQALPALTESETGGGA